MTTTGTEGRGGPLGQRSERLRRRTRALQLGEIHVVRFVPGSSPLHRMWAGTKLVALGALSIGMLLWPSWRSIGLMAALMLFAFLAARLPRGISPRIPWWLGGVVVIGAALALIAGGAPQLHVGSLKVGLGGLDNFGRFTVLGIDVLAAAALLGWTTPLADLSPALGRLLGPLRRVRLPVDELVGAIALFICCLPLLLEEARVLRAARRARRPAEPTPAQGAQRRSRRRCVRSPRQASPAGRRSPRRSRRVAGYPTGSCRPTPSHASTPSPSGLCVAAVAAMAVLR